MKKINTLLIGLGQIGYFCDQKKKQSFISHTKALQKSKFFNLVCAVEKNKTKRNLFIKNTGINVFKKISDALANYEIKFIVVCVNTKNIYQILETILKNKKKIKYVLVEKPLTFDIKKINKILQFYEREKIKLFINYNRSYQDLFLKHFAGYKKLKNLSLSTLIIEVLNNFSHFLNLIFIFLSIPEKILILKKGKKFKNEIQPDIKLIFKNGVIYLRSENIHHKSISKYSFYSTNLKVVSNKNFTILRYYLNVKKTKIQKYKNYVLKKNIVLNMKNYQTDVYKRIAETNKNVYRSKINNSAVKTLYLYNKILKLYNNYKK